MKVALLKGTGIGPEITEATQRALEATGIPFQWEYVPIADEAVAKHGHPFPPETIRQLKASRFILKAPLIVPALKGRISCTQEDGSVNEYPSLNNAIRRELGVFVNPRPIRGFSGISNRHETMDLIIMREVTEDVYAGIEHRIGNEMAAEAVKLTTRSAATRVAEFSFEYARKHGRKRVTCIHKANVLGMTDGLFLRCFYEVSQKFADIQADDMMIDAACYTIVRDPGRFDVVCTANQYGDIFSDLAAGLAGSLGLAPGANIGNEIAMFEACHGAAPDIAGKGVANPLALMLSGAMMLDAGEHKREADALRNAVTNVVQAGEFLTPDLYGTCSTDELATAVVKEVGKLLHIG